MISRIDHVAIAVRDYDKALHFFRDILGAVAGASAEDPHRKFLWCNFSLGDLTRLELLTPKGEGSFLEGFLRSRDGGVHHITLETPDIEAAKKHLEKHGIACFGYNEYPGGVWKEIFIHPRDAFGVLIQIAELRPDDWLASAVKMPCGEKWSIERKDGGATLTLAHPGGGRVSIELTGAELKRLREDLEAASL